MPTPTTYNYYPSLSNVISLDDIPESLGFIKEGLQSLFNSIFIKDYQSYISPRGDSGFYSLSVVSKKRLQFEVPGTGIFLILNPDSDDNTISSFPITVEYEWLILSYLRSFSLDSFSFSAKEFFELGLEILNVPEQDVVAVMINNFVTPANQTISKVEQFVQDLNDKLELAIPLPSTDDIILELTTAIRAQYGKEASQALFIAYLLQDADIDETLEKVKTFFKRFLPDDIDTYIKNIITPKARVTLSLSAAIEFPEKILKPVTPQGEAISGVKTKFQFAEALLYADTEAGIGYELELAGSLQPPFAEIGNTGLLLQIESLKLDLSKKTNIPEADADGRPADFTGVYARAISVTLPSKWFNDDVENSGTSATTLRLGGYDLLVGTGGVSGTIMLESVPVATGNGFQYYNDKFTFVYPVVMFEKDTESEKVKEKSLADYVVLRTYLMTLSTNAPYAFKYPLSLKPVGSNEILIFNNAPDYQTYLASLNNNTLWKKIGSSNGFKVGFNSFDITFKQNKIVSSNISGALEIKKFTYPENHPSHNSPVNINIKGHVDDNGGFNLTASAQPFPITLPDVFTYNLKSVELGREGDGDFYIGTSGNLQFEGILKELLNIGSIDIDRLRIYSDGSIDFQGGGSINLVKPIVLPLGPVNITVTAMHYGSHQKEINGTMRKFNFFGFDGGLKVDPLGVEIRGDGIKYYYCTEDSSLNYLHVETIYMDLTIPAKTPVAIIKGWLSIPEPGVSEEYGGGIKIQLPKAKITGSADMKLAPKYPAFIIDASLEFPAPIPLGTFAIYGFRGLLGYRYIAEKEAVGLVSGVDTWFAYYKKPPRGIHVSKFRGPNQTKEASDAFSIGAGASLGTSFDNGTVLNIKAMLLLSIPSLFMIDGQAAIISARLGLDDTKDPPFFAMLAIGDNSIEFGFGADFNMPTKSGDILDLYANVEAAFFFNDSSKWYVNIGTKTNPISAEVVRLITLKSYLMLSAKGIEAGARGEFDFQKTYAGIIKVHAWAYIEVGGKISFERPQFGAYMDAGIGADINVKIVHLTASFQVLLGVEATEPYRIYGQVRLKIYIKIAWVFKFKFNQNVDLLWEKSPRVNMDPVNPLLASGDINIIQQIVKGVNMLSNETFELAYLGDGEPPLTFVNDILDNIIPLDTYIDIKTEKGLLPGGVGNLIGGVNNAATKYTDLIPPDTVIKGKPLRQVKHQYSIEHISIKAWKENENNPSQGEWVDYHPYKALYPDDLSGILDSLKIGQYQKTDGVYNTIRILGTTPFSYTEQGQPDWYIPEQYGMTSGSLFCETEKRTMQFANFLNRSLGQQYFCLDNNQMFYSNNVAFLLNDQIYGEFGEVTNDANSFNFTKSLSFYNHNALDVILPQPSIHVSIKLSSNSQGLLIKYYSILNDNYTLQTPYGHPNPANENQNEPYIRIINISQLGQEIVYSHPSWRPIVKITIQPLYPNAEMIASLVEEIEEINNLNDFISLGLVSGEEQSTQLLEAELEQLMSNDGGVFIKNFKYDYNNNLYNVNNDTVWTNSWDTSADHKYQDNPFGFTVTGNIIRIESDYQLIKVKLLPQLASDFYTIDYNGKSLLIYVHDINDYINPGNPGLHFELTYYDSGCSKDDILCNLYESIESIFTNCFIDPFVVKDENLVTLKQCASNFLDLAINFDMQYPEYKIKENQSIQFTAIDDFSTNPTISNYSAAYDAVASIIDYVASQGNCYCRSCNKDYLLCDLSDELQEIVDNCLTEPSNTNPGSLSTLSGCIRGFRARIFDFNINYPSYELPKDHLLVQLSKMAAFTDSSPLSMGNYVMAYQAALESISIIRELGNCDCNGEDNNIPDNRTLFHEIGWMSLEDYEFNMNIPDIEAISEDVQATINGITKYIQPVWRPSTSYYIHFVLNDKVQDKTTSVVHPYKFTYGFTTAGPVGYFHTAEESTYGDIKLKTGEVIRIGDGDQSENIEIQQPSVLDDPNGVLQYSDGTPYPPEINNKIKAHPDSYALTSLKQYIDYERSYPYANGNLLSAKPLFYDDVTTQIYLFYNQAYASNFFANWHEYNGLKSINGRIKIVIKDPIEGTEVVNPPYLDYDENNTTTVNIPQTIEEWHTDQHPLMPFVISQWANLYNANNCIIVGADPIKPASKFTTVKLKHLKPSKLYTAIVNNLYGYDDPDFSELGSTREVHKFVFKTSRYANFTEQINSYLLSDGEGEDQVTKKAIFRFENEFTDEQIDMAFKTVIGDPNDGDALINNYQHAYDRIFEGILGMPPLDEAISTEFNVIRTINNNDESKVIAIIIRNSEPFNIPKIPIAQISDTIAIMNNGVPDNAYKVLFSKDYSQAIIMHSSKEIAATSLDIRFIYKIWDGYAYGISGNPVTVSIDLI